MNRVDIQDYQVVEFLGVLLPRDDTFTELLRFLVQFIDGDDPSFTAAVKYLSILQSGEELSKGDINIIYRMRDFYFASEGIGYSYEDNKYATYDYFELAGFEDSVANKGDNVINLFVPL